MLSEIRRERERLYDLTYTCDLKVKLREAESRVVVTRYWGRGGGEHGKLSVKGYKLSVRR